MSFAGRWEIVESPDFDAEYLNMEGTPVIELHQDRKRVHGQYKLGLQNGDLSGELESEGDDRFVFSFEGMDEMDPVHGAGTAHLNGDHLTLKLMYHDGDTFTFECERLR